MPARLGQWMLCAALGLAAGGAAAHAQLLPLEPPHLVNTTTAHDQLHPDVDRAPGGAYVVTWSSQGVMWQQFRILARRFATDGAQLGSEFEVGTQISDYDSRPQVAVNPSGGFLVVWQQADAGGTTVLARAYDQAGAALDPPFEIHSLSAGTQAEPDVVADPAGGYLVAWIDTADDGVAVRARRVSNAGARVGAAFPVVSTDFADNVAVDAVGPGSFLVAWSHPAEQENFGIYFRAVEADGTLGPRRFVGTGAIEYFVEYVRLAAQSDGSAIVTWSNEIFHANARYTRWMSPSGGIRADIPMAGLGDARVFSAPDDTWFLVWDHDPVARGRLYSPGGTVVGPDFDLPAAATTSSAPSIAFEASSSPVLVSVDYEEATGYDVFARRFVAAGIFLDGFDSGDSSAWSLVEP